MGSPDDDFLLGGGNCFLRQMKECFDAGIACGDCIDAFVYGVLLRHLLVIVCLAVFPPYVIVEGVIIKELECQTATDEIGDINGQEIKEVGDVISVIDESAVWVGIEKNVGLEVAQVDVGVACFVVGLDDAAAFLLEIGIGFIQVLEHVFAPVVDNRADEDEGLEPWMLLHEAIDLMILPFCFEQS